jgi:hypothetical protein
MNGDKNPMKFESVDPKAKVSFETEPVPQGSQVDFGQQKEPMPSMASGEFWAHSARALPGSAYNLGANVLKLFNPVYWPELARGANVAMEAASGSPLIQAISKDSPEDERRREMWKQGSGALAERYLTGEGWKRAIYEDPASPIADAAAILSGGAGAVGKLGQAGRLGSLSAGAARVAPKVAKAAEWANVGNYPVKAVGAGLKGARNVGLAVLGKTSGTQRTPRAAYEAGKTSAKTFADFKAGQKMTDQEALDTVTEKLLNYEGKTKQQFAADAGRVLDPGIDMSATVQGARAELQARLDDLNVVVQQTKRGPRITPESFRSSTVFDPQDRQRLTALFNTLETWTENTPRGAQKLKRMFAEAYTEGKSIAPHVEGVRDLIRKDLGKLVPGYDDMVGKYEDMAEFTKELRREFSLKNLSAMKEAPGPAIRKLSTYLAQNTEYRMALIDELNRRAPGMGRDLQSALSGWISQDWFPKGLMGPASAFGFVSLMNPFSRGHAQRWGNVIGHAAGATPFLSPKIAGNMAATLGVAERRGAQVGRIARQAQNPMVTAMADVIQYGMGKGADLSQESQNAPVQVKAEAEQAPSAGFNMTVPIPGGSALQWDQSGFQYRKSGK